MKPILTRFVLGGHLAPTDLRLLRQAGYIAPHGASWRVTDAGWKALR